MVSMPLYRFEQEQFRLERAGNPHAHAAVDQAVAIGLILPPRVVEDDAIATGHIQSARLELIGIVLTSCQPEDTGIGATRIRRRVLKDASRAGFHMPLHRRVMEHPAGRQHRPHEGFVQQPLAALL